MVVWSTYCSGVRFTSPCRPSGYTDGLRHLLLWGPFHLPLQTLWLHWWLEGLLALGSVSPPRAGPVATLMVWGTYSSGVRFTSPCRPYGYNDGLRHFIALGSVSPPLAGPVVTLMVWDTLSLWGPFHLPVQALWLQWWSEALYRSGVHFTSPCRPCGYIHGSSHLTDSRTYFSASSRVRQLHLSLWQSLITVRGKVMFSVILSTGEMSASGSGGGVHPLGRDLTPRQTTPPLWQTPSPETATAVDGTHPIEMHFCSRSNYLSFHKYISLTVSKNTTCMKFSL